MQYYSFMQAVPMVGDVEQIVSLSGGVCVTFPNVDDNHGPERAAYLEWLAEGNTPEPWPPAE